MDTVPLPPTCPACGAAIPADAPQGLCPRCALGGAAAPTDAPARGEPPPLDAVQAAFPQLEVIGLLGAGGMGFVFKARQPHLDRFVALKLLPVPLAADPHFSGRFLREGRLLARLAHPGIVSVYDFGQAGGFAYLLMEYVDGVNLRQAMAAGRFSPAEALAVVPKICEALQYAHGRGVLHRDIKPENLLLDAAGRVKIADFGIAKLLGEPAGGVTLTRNGAQLGTPSYMAPEQIETPADVDHRADIYSLGVVFYEMLTGELPLGRFAPPSEKTPLDARVDQIVMRALAKERELRQQSAGEVKTQVEGLAGAPAADPAGTGSAPAAGFQRRFEYRSTRTLFGLPLIHIAQGVDPVTGRPREARGIVAIGGHAFGVLAIGGFARGIIAFGGLAAGLFAFGGLSFGVVAVGGLAAGGVAFGGLALALLLAVGGIAAGWEAFGGIALGRHAFGGLVVAGEALPLAGWRAALLQWLPWLWVFIVPLSLVPGVVSVWAQRFLDGPCGPRGPRQNPWPHRLFWLVIGLVVLPLLAIVAGLVGPHSAGAALLLMLAGGAALVLGHRVTRPKAVTPQPWNPWPKRIFWTVVAAMVLPLTLVVGLLVPLLAKRAGPPSPSAARLESVERREGATEAFYSWQVRSPVFDHLAVKLSTGRQAVPMQRAGDGGFHGEVSLRLQPREDGRRTWVQLAVSSLGGERAVDEIMLAVPFSEVAAELAQSAVLRLWLQEGPPTLPLARFAGLVPLLRLSDRPLSLMPEVGELPRTLAEGDPRPAALKWHLAWKRRRELEQQAAVGVVAPRGPEVLAAERDMALAESQFKNQPEIAIRARGVYAAAALAIAERRFGVGQATEAEVDAARLAVAEAGKEHVAVPSPELLTGHEYVERMLGGPVPASVREERYSNDSRTSRSTGRPTRHHLRFRADHDDVLALLQRDGFAEGNWKFDREEGPAWWRSADSADLISYTREAKPDGCPVEALWWDRVSGEVFYFRSCT